MADIGEVYKRYASYIDTFKNTSFDSSQNHEYLCNDTSQQVIHFDKIVEDIYPNSYQRPNSFDAIFINEDNIYCIEFKNQKPSQIKSKVFHDKLIEGKNELSRILQENNISPKDYTFIYVVVYKECQSNYEKYKCGIGNKQIRFGLEKYKKNGFVKDVFTQDVTFFTRAFRLKFHKDLTC